MPHRQTRKFVHPGICRDQLQSSDTIIQGVTAHKEGSAHPSHKPCYNHLQVHSTATCQISCSDAASNHRLQVHSEGSSDTREPVVVNMFDALQSRSLIIFARLAPQGPTCHCLIRSTTQVRCITKYDLGVEARHHDDPYMQSGGKWP